jgi:O-antigen ligase
LLLPALIALATKPLGRWSEPKLIVMPILGLVALGQVAFRPALESKGWTHLAVGWLALFITLWLIDQRGTWVRFLVLTLIVLGGIEALYGLMQAIGGFDYIGSYFRGRGSMATGTLINRNHFAFTLTLILPLALGALYASNERRRQARQSRTESWAQIWIVLLCCSFMGVGVLLSQSRGGTITLALTLLFVALLLNLRSRSSQREAASGAIAWILLATVAGLGVAIGVEALLERFGKLNENLARIDVYKDTLRLIGDNLLLGVGPGMYIWRFRPYQTIDGGRVYDHAHNDYLESAAEWGALIAIAVWAFVFWRFLQTSRRFLVSRSTRRQGLALGCAAAIFSVLVHSLVDFSLQLPALLMLFTTVLGLSWSLDLDRSKPRIRVVEDGTEQRAPRSAAAGGLVLRVLLIILLIGAGWSVLRHLRSLLSTAPVNGGAGLERAVGIDPGNPGPRFLLGMAYRDLPGFGSPSLAMEQLAAAVRLNPYQWRYRLELGRAQELLGDLEGAEQSLAESVRLNPISGEYRWRLANLQLRRGEVDKAVQQIGRALEFDRRLREPALALLVKSGADLAAIDAVWPDDRDARLNLLRALSAGRVSTEPASVGDLESQWRRIAAAQPAPTLKQAQPYIAYLLERGETGLARERWIEVNVLNGHRDTEFESRDNLVWNGSFELELSGAPLGWQVGETSGVTVEQTESTGQVDRVGLQLEFDGSENLSYASVRQQVVVDGGVAHTLSYSVRSEDVTTDQGLVVEVVPGHGGRALYVGPMIVGSADWQTQTGTFLIPEETSTVLVRLRRTKSRQIDNRIQGTLWFDRFRLQGAGG